LLLLICISVFVGSILYLVLWFRLLNVHDYYLIHPVIFIPLVLLTFLCFMNKEYPALLRSGKIKFMGAIILLFSVYSCAVKTQMKYDSSYGLAKYSYLTTKQDIGLIDWYNWDYSIHLGALETITPYLRSLNISRTDKVISIPDFTFNVSLYLMDQKGFPIIENPLRNNEAKMITDDINKGARYLIINDPKILSKEWIQPYITQKIGEYKTVTIYRL
jgi:hypothetical protein